MLVETHIQTPSAESGLHFIKVCRRTIKNISFLCSTSSGVKSQGKLGSRAFSLFFFTHARNKSVPISQSRAEFHFRRNHFQSAVLTALGSKSSGRMQMQLPNRRQMDSPTAHTCRSISDFELKKWLATCGRRRRSSRFWSPPPHSSVCFRRISWP
jgi:hypothetical protein